MAENERNESGPENLSEKQSSRRDPGIDTRGGSSALVHVDVLLDALPDAILETDTTGRVRWANREFLRRFGMAHSAVRGQYVTIVAGPYASQEEGEALLEIVKAGGGSIELTAFTQGGMSFPTLVRVTSSSAVGEGTRLVVVTDTSERHRLRAELVVKAEAAQREKEILRATTESIADCVLIADDSERLVLINGEATKLMGLVAAEVYGRPIANVDLPGVLRGKWLAFLASGQPAMLEAAEITLHGQPLRLELQMARVQSSRGIPLGSVLVVREQRPEAEDALREDSLVLGLGHELRTPLASIQGVLTTLSVDESLGDEVRSEFLDILRRDAQRLGSLVENLIELCQVRSQTSRMARHGIDLRGIVREAVQLVAEEARLTDEQFTIELGDEALVVPADRRRMRHVIVELLRNAVRHGWSSRGVRIRLRPEGHRVLTEIRDWGAGMTGDEAARLYRRGPSARSASAIPTSLGRGLGSELVREVVDQHAGQVQASVPDDGGFSVVVSLPRGEE